MGSVRDDWEEVGSKLTGLGLKLKMHFEQAAKDGRPADEDVVKENLHKVGDAVEQAFAALGSASRDDAVRQDVKDAGRSMLEALDATFSELGERFRSAVKSSEESEAEDGPAPQSVPVSDDVSWTPMPAPDDQPSGEVPGSGDASSAPMPAPDDAPPADDASAAPMPSPADDAPPAGEAPTKDA